MHRVSYKLLLLFTILATVGGIITMLPRQAASYPNVVYYLSVCTYAPAATAWCFLLAGLSCFIRGTFIKDQSGSASERFRRHAKSLIPLGLLLIAALFFHVRYLNIKAQYTDTAASATVEATEE